ncbi:DUF1546-domain-containing protein [Xylariaceae sp. FL0016]|nr:DUF1546-domain-containing protein [Xylariaceae sp. FL0016]
MATTHNARGSISDAANKAQAVDRRLFWNVENVRDVAEAVGISQVSDEVLRHLALDVEYRLGQVITESLRLMRNSKRTSMGTKDVSLALRALDAEPLYGYDSARPLKYGEASLGPGQPLFYIEDEEVELEKMINGPLPKIPRDVNFTSHWLAIEGVQPTIPQNPTTAESQSQSLLPKGPGANPAMAALAGHDNANFRPAVKHIVSQEQVLFFEKVQSALMDDNPDPEVQRLRTAALGVTSTDPGIHQLVPYFVQFISNQITHHLDDVFILRRMMELTGALIENQHLHLEPYASPLSAPVLTCLMGRKLGSDSGAEAVKEQYQLREYAAALIGQIARKYSSSNKLLKPKIVRSCLSTLLKPNMPAQVWFGAISGISSAGGPESVKVLVLPHLKDFERGMLGPLREKGDSGRLDLETLVGGIMKAISTLADSDVDMMNGVNGGITDRESEQVTEYLGEILGDRVQRLGNHELNLAILDAANFY